MLDVEDFMNHLSLELFNTKRKLKILDKKDLQLISAYSSEKQFKEWYATHYVNEYIYLFKPSFNPQDYFICYIDNKFEYPIHSPKLSLRKLLLLQLTFLSKQGIEIIDVQKFNELQTNIATYNSLQEQTYTNNNETVNIN